MSVPLVKICGLARRVDAAAAAAAGADLGGVILAPGSPRTIAPEAAAELFAGLPLRRVGVFVDAPPDMVLRDADTAGLDVVQLHGDESPGEVRAIRAAGAREVWKAVRPRDGAEFADAVRRYAGVVDALLLDGWAPDARGGTGRRFPWEEVAALRDLLPAGVALVAAGGLHARNVAEAVRVLRPAVVDVSSGVETAPGVKDPAAIAAFVSAARATPGDPHPSAPEPLDP